MSIITLDQKRSEDCFVEVQGVLKRYGCMILPKVVITGQVISEYGFVVVAVPAVPVGLEGDFENQRSGLI